MSFKFELVKIPNHLHSLWTSSRAIAGYTTLLTTPIVQYFRGLSLLDLEKIKYAQLLKLLYSFKRVTTLSNPGEYTVQGDIISIWPLGYDLPLKLSFFGEDFEQAYHFDPTYGRKTENVKQVYLSTFIPDDPQDHKLIHVLNTNNQTWRIILPYVPENLPKEIELEVIDTDFTYPPLFFNRLDLAEREITRWESLGYTIGVITSHPESNVHLEKYLLNPGDEFAGYGWDDLKALPAGFISQTKKLVYLSDRELLGTINLAKSHKQTQENELQGLMTQFEGEVSMGDFVVHEDYGVAVYKGFVQEQVGQVMEDYLQLAFAGDDQLFVPMHQINKVSKFLGDSLALPRLTKLGRQQWQSVKKKVNKSVGVIARQLLQHYARREKATAQVIAEVDSSEYEKFTSEFPYPLTPDQHRTVNEIIADLAKPKPMNRLLVGDVGFGKTEVFLRAAFKVAEAGYQVAILCPTTVLAAQHLSVAKRRYGNTKLKIAAVSRFNPADENRKIIDDLNAGELDVVIGTHRLLSSDVKFPKLGLLIIDEEQKFGVKQKEKLKHLNYGVHQLSVTATPIPRTLSMALSSIQDISVIASPPVGRKSIKTELLRNDWNLVTQAIQQEISRGGQVYFIHNVVHTIENIQAKLLGLMPGLRTVVAHGQMAPSKLDKIMSDFYQKKYDVLIATTIIENGIDMPNANTIVVNKAHTFGLSQLYQLRGRIGRADRQAYCYLFYEGRSKEQELELMQNAEKDKIKPKEYLQRLEAILNTTELGAGFQVASKDLEIRGAGNMLGEQQSGHIAAVGYHLYMQMLSQEIARLKHVSTLELQLPVI